MRVIRDVVGNVTKDGTTLHTNVRVLVDDKQRVAVFTSTSAPPTVYEAGTVEYTRTRTPCSCKGDPHKQVLGRLWAAKEAAARV